MNKRQAKKLYRKFNNDDLDARQSCVYCINWGLGCANGHDNVYPGDRSDYLIFCKERMDAVRFLKTQLKKSGISLSGWRLSEIPIAHVYIFINKKKHKDLTILFNTDKQIFEIYSTDLFWKYSEKYNMYQHQTVIEALSAPWQRYW